MTLFVLMARVLTARARMSNLSLVIALSVVPQMVHAMDAAGALSLFRGGTISGEYANGATFIEQFRAGGRTIYADDSGISEGNVSVSDGLLCFEYPGAGGLTGGCFTVERHGANCFTFYGADALQDGGTWTARAWRTDGPSTCQDVPVG